MNDVFLCDGIRTPIGRYGGALSSVRADDLAAIPLRALVERNPGVDWAAVDDVYYGCANQAGEDNRNVARMALLLAGPADRRAGRDREPPVRLGHGGDRDLRPRDRARARRELMIAGGVESMTRAPFVMPKADSAFARTQRGVRHDDRLALRQSADEEAVRHRLDARDGRERRRGVRHRARRPGRLRAALAAALRRGAGARLSSRARSCR